MKTKLVNGICFAAIGAFSIAAHAQTWTGTMCGDFNKSAAGCSNGGIEGKDFDKPVTIIASTAKKPLDKLLLFFHGHGDSPGTHNDFLNAAAAEGYDTIDLDYDYSRDYPNPGAGKEGHCTNPDSQKQCHTDSREVCGCYSDCTGDRWQSIWQGGSHAGLPTVGADWTVNARVKNALSWMKTKLPRFGDYLDVKQLGGINWAGKPGGSTTGSSVGGVTLAAHSMGTALIGYIARGQKVDRVILFSGICDKLAPDVSSQFFADHSTAKPWTEGYGCDSCNGTDENGQPYTFSGCACKPTVYSFGDANHLGYCALSAKAPGWILDNNFGAGTGATHWQTDISRFYGFADSADSTCNWDAPKAIATQRNWDTLNLKKQHAAGVADGWSYVGDYQTPEGPQSGKFHGLLSTTIPKHTDSQICGASQSGAHGATVGNNACSGETAANKARNAVWTFTLTNP